MKAIIDNEIVDLRVAFVNARMNPLCGWLWLEENLKRQCPPQSITISYDGNPILKLTPDDKPTKKWLKRLWLHIVTPFENGCQKRRMK